jgi:hypothetical protein
MIGSAGILKLDSRLVIDWKLCIMETLGRRGAGRPGLGPNIRAGLMRGLATE